MLKQGDFWKLKSRVCKHVFKDVFESSWMKKVRDRWDRSRLCSWMCLSLSSPRYLLHFSFPVYTNYFQPFDEHRCVFAVWVASTEYQVEDELSFHWLWVKGHVVFSAGGCAHLCVISIFRSIDRCYTTEVSLSKSSFLYFSKVVFVLLRPCECNY